MLKNPTFFFLSGTRCDTTQFKMHEHDSLFCVTQGGKKKKNSHAPSNCEMFIPPTPGFPTHELPQLEIKWRVCKTASLPSLLAFTNSVCTCMMPNLCSVRVKILFKMSKMVVDNSMGESYKKRGSIYVYL